MIILSTHHPLSVFISFVSLQSPANCRRKRCRNSSSKFIPLHLLREFFLLRRSRVFSTSLLQWIFFPSDVCWWWRIRWDALTWDDEWSNNCLSFNEHPRYEWICAVSYQSGFFTHYSLLWLLRLNLVKKMLKHLTTSRVGTSRFGECGHIQINGRASFTSGHLAAWGIPCWEEKLQIDKLVRFQLLELGSFHGIPVKQLYDCPLEESACDQRGLAKRYGGPIVAEGGDTKDFWKHSTLGFFLQKPHLIFLLMKSCLAP